MNDVHLEDNCDGRKTYSHGHTPSFSLWHNDKGAFSITGPDGSVVCSRGDWDHRASESIANAHLIAAAPDMLAALRALLPEGWGDDDTMDHMPGVKAARLAIAKATAS